MYNYNYIFFNNYDDKFKIDINKYYTICIQDLYRSPQINIVNYPLDYMPKWVRYIFGIHNSEKIAKIIKLPFKKLWYPFYFRNRFDDLKPLCFIISQRSLDLSYLNYLKRKYPSCKIVLIHRDLIKVCKRIAPELPFNPVFDLEMTYDQGEGIKYGLPTFVEFESKIGIVEPTEPESDVFFAGKAKDRLPLLLAAHKVFTDAGLKVFFFITGVSAEYRKPLPGIVYSDSPMTYREMLEHTVNARCLLDINQEGAVGYTSRFLEAVMYGRRLITNNPSIRASKFFSSGYIQIVDKIEEIDPSFVSDEWKVDYHYNDEFSPFSLIDRIEEELIKKYGE